MQLHARRVPSIRSTTSDVTTMTMCVVEGEQIGCMERLAGLPDDDMLHCILSERNQVYRQCR